MLEAKIISSLEKAFIDQKTSDFAELKRISALKGERFSFQLIYTYTGEDRTFFNVATTPKIEGKLAKYVKLHRVNHVPIIRAADYLGVDDQYLRTTPGLYPDLLSPMRADGKVMVLRGGAHTTLESLWFEINIPEDCDAIGESDLTVSLINCGDGQELTKNSLTVDVINASLPEQKLIFTQWFYCDCLADFYGVPVWSERHWEIIENYAKIAVKSGINMLLTPVFTPPLDTEIGGERPTTQLVGIKKTNGRYFFSYKLLDRWIDMCDRVGIKYFEIAHLFTQWGACHAPKIMATVDGEYKQIFGWDTDAHGEEYKQFIRCFLKSFIAHMKKLGYDKRCFYHISDEPNPEQLEDYKKSKKIVERILKDYTIMDALSSYEFYKRGVVKTPIPATDHIDSFIKGKVENLWTYYCCGQCKKVSNRFISMPSWRTRSIGMQMYKYDIVGFLHWGFNYYNNRNSINPVEPYLDLSGDEWVSAGDCFTVYPGRNGTPLESLRALVFHDAICDIRAMQLCESLYSKEEVVAAIEGELGEVLTFDRCAYSADEMMRVREKINSMIKARV